MIQYVTYDTIQYNAIWYNTIYLYFDNMKIEVYENKNVPLERFSINCVLLG